MIAVAVSTLRCFVAVLIEVFYRVLIKQQIRAAETRQFDAVAVIPFHHAMQDFAVRKNYCDRRMPLHLFDVVEILRESLVRRSGLLSLPSFVRTSCRILLLFHFSQ